ncbi:MAG TPA: nucleotide exchange factor GrpE [Thermoanaerobaculia bacterium]
MDEKNPGGAGAMDDDGTYIIEDTGGSVEEIEREMRETAEEAEEAVSDDDAPSASGLSAAPPVTDAALRDENQQLKDRYLRTLADFDNLRKRTEREKADFFRYALAGAMKDILPVLDNFDRALDHAAEGDEFHKGVLLIYKQLFEVLQRHGLKAIDESGVHFDPNIHEAVVREEDDSVPSHTVVAVLQKGFFLHDRLLRPALVKVAVGGPDRTA